jgi:hypothetical protein
MYLVLLKVSFSLLKTGLIYRAAMLPNAPPSEGERVIPQGMDRVMNVVIKWPSFVGIVRLILSTLF